MRVLFLVLPCLLGHVAAIYNPVTEYAGDAFFDKFAYYGNVDNTTWGNVTFLNQADATVQQLTFVNGAGNAIIKVDNTTTLTAGAPGVAVNRNSVRLTSLDSYGMGSLIIIDALHIPFGCSVWPSFWTVGIETEWPLSGEIDIIEAINDMNNNQVALHTVQGCAQQVLTPPAQTGHTVGTDCSVPEGCLVTESQPNSYGPGFAAAGGGVYALQMEVSGICLRPNVPPNIQSATTSTPIDTSTWGLPTAAYPAGASCNVTQFFPPQNLVLLTTLCGVWAGVPSIYTSTCHTPTGDCFTDNVLGNGSNYADAYWEIRYIRTYLSSSAVPSGAPSPTAGSPTAGDTTTVITSTVVKTGLPTVAPPASSAGTRRVWAPVWLLALVGSLLFFML
ncbi:concanavalin A-like lectin/glucanase domain-containing protein [Pholiota molesta]|nr:concanavalin A-like lectin/glucanase domain-containing protein [Pholiota molesta]